MFVAIVRRHHHVYRDNRIRHQTEESAPKGYSMQEKQGRVPLKPAADCMKYAYGEGVY
jgi:hypothetical protein